MIAQVGDGGGECSAFGDGVFVDTYHEGRGVVEGFFDFEVETFVDDAFYGALGEAEFTSNGFVVDVFAVFMGNHLPVLFAGSLFREEAFHGFPEEVGAALTFVAFCFDEQCSSDAFMIDEGGFARVVVVEF